ncbi:GL12950 [Drosophila persimilis]|uniref:GL12950 n=1 Tax=Drosophila persimilis TaxID=7234 RepID=B4GUW1_DROPE|nr:GL12950 [Drosophila persimilis]
MQKSVGTSPSYRGEQTLTPAALEILKEHKKMDGSIQNLVESFCEYKDSPYALCKTMVRMKRARDIFMEQKEGCLELMEREGKIKELMVVVGCINASLELIRYVQDMYQHRQMNYSKKSDDLKVIPLRHSISAVVQYS